MGNLMFHKGEFISSASITDQEMRTFLQNGVNHFFAELTRYIDQNNDEGIVHYATERTMASLFVTGNLRADESLTGVQEYGTLCTKNGTEVKGRPDIFIKAGDNAIWIEAKFNKNTTKLGTDHWDIPGWLEWDSRNAFSQVETYYNSERNGLNSCYKKRYLATLCFKLIKEDISEHENKVRTELKSKINENHRRMWYYQVGFFPGEETEAFGLEVYGTWNRVE